MASESGVLPIKEDNIVRKWRLQPGKMLLIDFEEGRIIEDEEIKAKLAGDEPYEKWLEQAQYKLDDLDVVEPELAELPRAHRHAARSPAGVRLHPGRRHRASSSRWPMNADDPIGSMGTDTPIAVLSDKSRLLYDYFKQNFAQVTNPPIDPIREELVMSLVSMIGPRPNLLGHDAGTHKRLEVSQPILTDEGLAKIRSVEAALDGAFRTETIDITWDADTGAEGLEMAIKEMCWAATEAVLADKNILILSDRAQGPDRIPMPALLATAAVHHHLVRQGLRMQTGLVVETGEAREVHHFCALAGYGAEAINPYVAFETLEADPHPQESADFGQSRRRRTTSRRSARASARSCPRWASRPTSPIAARRSSTRSACRARSSTSTSPAPPPRSKASAWPKSPQETVRRHAAAYGDNPIYAQHARCRRHLRSAPARRGARLDRENIGSLQHAVRGNLPEKYREFAQTDQRPVGADADHPRADGASCPATSRSRSTRSRPASEIVKRFATGAMSYGSISWEAHTTLALAMNRIGGKSNTGEGGEDPDALHAAATTAIRCARRSSRSHPGRFGVTTEYLVNADDIQIKMAQGAKPGEGGQLPGHKVDKTIGATRHSTPGVGLISPPPHHDIYSIEDLAQLIHDLKNVNPTSAHLGQAGVRSRRRHGGRGRFQGARRPCHDLGL